jgi:hypothetical protein
MKSSLLPLDQNLHSNGCISLLFYLMLLFMKKKKKDRKSIGRQEEHWTTAERSVEPTHLILVIAAGTTVVFV